jgi:hypothetical protein
MTQVLNATTVTMRPPWPRTHTERNWLASAGIVFASVAIAAAIYSYEVRSGLWDADLRFIHAPTETVMRLFGIAHFLIGTAFLVSSRGMRGTRAWLKFAGMLGVGAALCFGFARLAVMSAPIASALFLLYFATHDFRDQVFFYFEHGEAPAGADRAGLGALLFWAPLWLLFGVGAGLIGLTVAGVPGASRLREMAAGLPSEWCWGLGTLVVGLFAFASSRIWQLRRCLGPGSLGAHLRANRPIYVVFGGIFLAAASGALPGMNAQVIVILHVVSWYVFTIRRLLERPLAAAAPRAGSWRWLRGTATGFRTLHLGLVALLVVAALVWAKGYGSDRSIVPLRLFLDQDFFAAWTLVHVTVSFRPR